MCLVFKILELCKTNYVIAESRKIGLESTYSFATLEKVSGIITDSKLSDELTLAAEKLGVKIITAD